MSRRGAARGGSDALFGLDWTHTIAGLTWLTDAGSQVDTEDGSILIQRIYGILAVIPRWIMLPLAASGHRVMEVRMLRGIKRRAESMNR